MNIQYTYCRIPFISIFYHTDSEIEATSSINISDFDIILQNHYKTSIKLHKI